jgi:hypothetical protein
MRRPAALCIALVSAAAAALGSGAAQSHELQAQRATLVQREDRHLSLSIQMRFGDLLHRVLAPQRPLQEFLVVHAAMPPQELARALQAVQHRVEAGTRITRNDGSVLALSAWRWPEAGRVQAALQQLSMQAIVAPGEHLHEEPLEVQAEALAPTRIDAVRLQLPPELKPMLVVWYRPQQTWARPGTPPLSLRFEAAPR